MGAIALWPARPRLEETARTLRRVVGIARANSARDAWRFARALSAEADFRSGWIAFLEEFAAAHGLPSDGVDLLMKPLNQYLMLDLPLGERIRMLRSHYTL